MKLGEWLRRWGDTFGRLEPGATNYPCPKCGLASLMTTTFGVEPYCSNPKCDYDRNRPPIIKEPYTITVPCKQGTWITIEGNEPLPVGIKRIWRDDQLVFDSDRDTNKSRNDSDRRVRDVSIENRLHLALEHNHELRVRWAELERENAELRHDLVRSMANHVADLNDPLPDHRPPDKGIVERALTREEADRLLDELFKQPVDQPPVSQP